VLVVAAGGSGLLDDVGEVEVIDSEAAAR